MSWPTPDCDKLIDAMVIAEGGPSAFLRAVRISVPSCADVVAARAIAANTIAHLAFDWTYEVNKVDFVKLLGARWAPVDAPNDPSDLNANWIPNVLRALGLPGETK